MNFILGLIIIAAGLGYGLYQFRKKQAKLLEMQSMQTSSISDVIDVVDSLSETDPNYRHYAEIKGTIHCEEPLVTPFTGQEVSYYHAVCKSVNEITREERRDNGEIRTTASKDEQTLSDERRCAKCYITDNTSSHPLYVNIESFASNLDEEKGCDRMEREDAPFIMNNRGYFSSFSNHYHRNGARFLGYRLIEKTFGLNRPVYCLGEIFKAGGAYYIEASAGSNKSSALTHKSEEMIVKQEKNGQLMTIVIMAAAVVGGLFLMFK